MKIPQSDKEYSKLVVVVTGASAGLGRAIVREFAKKGASIGLLAREPKRLQKTKAEVESCYNQGSRSNFCCPYAWRFSAYNLFKNGSNNKPSA